jgi:hypothetical protein
MLLVAAGIVFIVGAAALVVDFGLAAHRRVEAQQAADAGALAGAMSLSDGVAAAFTAADELVTTNGFASSACALSTKTTGWPNDTVVVDITEAVPTGFARIFGVDSVEVHAHAAAQATGTGSNLTPFGLLVYDQEPDGDLDLDDIEAMFTVGVSYEIKVGPGGHYDGNFQAVALGGTGADVYHENIINGYRGLLCGGDIIDTEPGNMRGPTVDALDERLLGDTWVDFFPWFNEGFPHPFTKRVIDVPIIAEPAGGRIDTEVIGFARMFIEGEPDSWAHGILSAVFIEIIDTCSDDFTPVFGVVRLVE